MATAFTLEPGGLEIETVYRILADLRTAIRACEVDDATYALPLLRTIQRALVHASPAE